MLLSLITIKFLSIHNFYLVLFFKIFDVYKHFRNHFHIIKNQGNFFNSTEEYMTLSSEARELIEGLLTVDPTERYSMDDVFDSDWMPS